MTPLRASTNKIGGVAGILFFVWVAVAVTVINLARPPLMNDPGSYYRAYYVDNAAMLLWVDFLGAASWTFFFLTFAAGLRSHLSGSDDRVTEFWARLALGGAVLGLAIGGSGLVFESVLASGLAHDVSDDLIRAIAQMQEIIDTTVLNWPLALFLCAAAAAILRSGLLRRWLAWLGIASASLLAFGGMWPIFGTDGDPLAYVGLTGLVLFGLWVLLVGTEMFRVAGPSGGKPA